MVTILEIIARAAVGIRSTLRGISAEQVKQHQLLKTINGRMDHMATQADIDTLTQQVSDFSTAVSSSLDGIQGDLDVLKAANPTLDLAALQDKVSALAAVADKAAVVDAENPAPTA